MLYKGQGSLVSKQQNNALPDIWASETKQQCMHDVLPANKDITC